MIFYDYHGNVVAEIATPLTGKKICLIGDSNTQYSGAGFKTYFEETYGCTFVPLGYAGATWETANGTSATDNSAVGRVNTLIANADADTKLCTDYDMVLIMMGTNCSNLGAVTDKSTDVSTMCGAMRYCLEKLVYYYRKSKIGVILPPQRDGDGDNSARNDIIKQIAGDYSVATLDLFHEGQIVGNTKLGVSAWYFNDGLHFGDNGDIAFKQTVGKWMAYQL